MIDPLTERRHADVRELMDLWSRYIEFFKVAVGQNEPITAEREHEFISVKSRIAMLHDVFMDCLQHDQNIGQNVLSIVTRSITLKHVRRMSTAEVKKIELEWHESYLLLNETIGTIEETRRKFASVTQGEFYRQMYRKKTTTVIKQFLSSWVFKSMVVFTVLLFAAWGFDRFGVREAVMQYPMGRKAVTKFEDLARLAYKQYPYRELASLQRMDTVPISEIKWGEQNAQNLPDYTAEKGIQRVDTGMGSDADNVAEDLKKQVECRAELYENLGPWGGGTAVLWLFRMPTNQMAVDIQIKYDRWYDKNAAQGSQALTWRLIRRGNVIGVITGGDDPGRIREYIRRQYLRIRN
jgi:hypothetical protein